MKSVHPSPSEVMQTVRYLIDRDSAESFAAMREHVSKTCDPHHPFDYYKPAYAKDLLGPLSHFNRAQLTRLERALALCIAARAPVVGPKLEMVLQALSLIAEYEQCRFSMNAGRQKGGAVRQCKLDPARRTARRLAKAARSAQPDLCNSQIAKKIAPDVVRFIRENRLSVVTEASFQRTLKKWIST